MYLELRTINMSRHVSSLVAQPLRVVAGVASVTCKLADSLLPLPPSFSIDIYTLCLVWSCDNETCGIACEPTLRQRSNNVVLPD